MALPQGKGVFLLIAESQGYALALPTALSGEPAGQDSGGDEDQ